MKLAEALMERADLSVKIDQLETRIQSNCLVQEGEIPLEDPKVLMEELDSCIVRLQYLISKINLTNCSTVIEGRTITEIIAEKDVKMKQLNAYRTIG